MDQGQIPPLVYQACTYALWFYLYSFVGWVWEVCLAFYQHHRFVNRGFFHGPLLPIYGFGGLLAALLTGRLESLPLVFAVGMASSVVLEYLTSWALERLFHARWWDYTGWFLNINGRVCLAGAVAFGAMALVVTRLVNPALARICEALPPEVVVGLPLAFTAVFAVDALSSIVHAAKFRGALDAVQERLSTLATSASTALSQTAGEARERASAGVELARERAAAGVELARERAGSVCEAAGEQARDVRERAAELRERLARIAPGLRHLSGPEVRDLDFRPTSSADAWRLVRGLVRPGRDRRDVR